MIVYPAIDLRRGEVQIGAAQRVPVDFGPPEVPKPAHEMMGELLLELGKPAEAVPEFEAALERAPKRSRSLLGLARARTRAGDAGAGRAVYRELAAIWHTADEDLPDLDEVRAAAASQSGSR